jgi:iron complex transport system substrate-binding protein
VYDSKVQQLIGEGTIADVGDAMTPNVELILHTAPDAVMVSTYAQGDAVTEKLISLGMPVIYNNEWTENDPLARAEWIRFVGAFFDLMPQADSVFQQVENNYIALRDKVKDTDHRRSIMSGNNFRGTWYMPSGNTYMGRLFADAGADYRFADDSSAFSIPLTVENVVMNFENADVWVGAPAHSLSELQTIDEKHTWFRSFKQGEVYNFLRRTTPEGANDFWESGVAHPERILRDLILVLYPDKITDNKEFYYTEHLIP